MVQCKGITKKGIKCKRNSIEGQKYCYVHIHGIFNKITYGLSELFGVKRRVLMWCIIFSIILFFSQVIITHKIDNIFYKIEKNQVLMHLLFHLFRENRGAISFP
ncbi:MAG: hypothetical protein NTV63_00850 [Candidatus Woesearchaeota archaeon]|nr:hypothetical protein [Candidatus Woesearchaeota archaeon]